MSVERGGTTGSGIDSIAVRHTASVRHHRHAAVRGTAPHRQHGGLGGWWQRHRRSRRNHTRASRHSVSGRGTGIQRTRPADAARTIGIRVCGAFPFKRQHLLPGLIPTHHGGQPLSVRILLRHRRTLRLPGKRPYTLFLAIVRTDIGSCGYSDGGATSLAHCRAKRANRRVQ